MIPRIRSATSFITHIWWFWVMNPNKSLQIFAFRVIVSMSQMKPRDRQGAELSWETLRVRPRVGQAELVQVKWFSPASLLLGTTLQNCMVTIVWPQFSIFSLGGVTKRSLGSPRIHLWIQDVDPRAKILDLSLESEASPWTSQFTPNAADERCRLEDSNYD